MGAFSGVRLWLWWERAFWVIPLTGVVLRTALNAMVGAMDDYLAEATGGSVRIIAAAQASQLLAAIGGGMITFTGFVFSFVVLILQFGSSQYSPRTVSYFLRAKSTRYILAIFPRHHHLHVPRPARHWVGRTGGLHPGSHRHGVGRAAVHQPGCLHRAAALRR